MYVCAYAYMYIDVCTCVCMRINRIQCVCMHACTYVCVCTTVCLHVCMLLCTYDRMCVCRQACLYVCMYACMHARMHACMNGWMYGCMMMYGCMDVCMHWCIHASMDLCVQVRMYGCMDVWMLDVWMLDVWTDGRMGGWVDGWTDGRMDGCSSVCMHLVFNYAIYVVFVYFFMRCWNRWPEKLTAELQLLSSLRGPQKWKKDKVWPRLQMFYHDGKMMKVMHVHHVHQQIQLSQTWRARPSGPRSLDAHHVCWWIPGRVRSLFAAHRRRVAEQVGFLSLCSHRSRNHPRQKAAKRFTELIRQTDTKCYRLIRYRAL